MADLQIKPISRSSGISGQPFLPGETVISRLYLDEKGEPQRIDVLADEAEKLTSTGVELCRWSRIIKPAALTEAEAKRQALMGAEEMFLSLAGPLEPTVDGGPARPDPQLLALLALLLERKRILRPLARKKKGVVSYYHPRSKREVDIPEAELPVEAMLNLAGKLEGLLDLG